MGKDQVLSYCRLGRAPYRATWDLQRAIQRHLIQSKRAIPPVLAPHVLLQVEHPAVYTLGKSGDRENLLISDSELSSLGAQFEHIDRGGDITFHGPGQLVMYPIIDLERVFTDLGKYLRGLEEAVIQTLDRLGLVGRRVKGRTGVWIGPDQSGLERKICAMGIKCSRWVTTHGLALNINTDLSYFDHIVPCGIADREVTSIQHEVGTRIVDREMVQTIGDQLSCEIARVLGLDLQVTLEPTAFLGALIGDTSPTR